MHHDVLGLVRRDAGVLDGIGPRVPGKSGLRGETAVVAVVGALVLTSRDRRVRREALSVTASSLMPRLNRVDMGRTLSPTKSVFVGGALLGEPPPSRASERVAEVVGFRCLARPVRKWCGVRSLRSEIHR